VIRQWHNPCNSSFSPQFKNKMYFWQITEYV
jgi:hypothetical protein